MSFGNTKKDGTGIAYWLTVDNEGRLQVVGPVAEGEAASGAPLRVGGVYQSSPTEVNSGEIVSLLVDSKGYLRTDSKESSLIQVTQTTTIKQTGGRIFSIFISHSGATAGDTVVLKDGDEVKLTYTCAVANSNFAYTFGRGAKFGTNIKVEITHATGTFKVAVEYS